MQIRSRTSWGARKPRPRTRQSLKSIDELFVHWPGSSPSSWRNVNTTEEEERAMRGIQAFHMGPERGWSDFAYNFAIFPSGRIYRARGLGYVPAAQEGHNTGTIAVIVFLGPNDDVPNEVIKSLRYLKRYVAEKTGNRIIAKPHKSVTATSCPGPRLTRIVKDI